jgi:hypothetical protein
MIIMGVREKDDYNGLCCFLPSHQTSLVLTCDSLTYSVGYKHHPFPSAVLISFSTFVLLTVNNPKRSAPTLNETFLGLLYPTENYKV